MKKLLTAVLISALFLYGCSDEDELTPEEPSVPEQEQEQEQENEDGDENGDDQDNDEDDDDQTEETVPKEGLYILCIGNSFTRDALEHLPGMISAAGISDVKIVNMHYNGRTIPEHYAKYAGEGDYTCYTFEKGTSTWTETEGASLKQVVQSDIWDIVTIQEHTGTSYAWNWDAQEKNAIEGLIGYIKEDQGENEPKFDYIMSQAYFDLTKVKNTAPFTTQAEMFEVITTQAQSVLAETSVEEIIPTGTALQNLRTSSLNNDMDLTRDGYHMDYGISRYAASCVVFEMLLTPVYDIKLDNNTYRYSVSDRTSGSYSTPVTDDNQPIALEAARYAIENPFEVTDMSDGTEEETPELGYGTGTADDPYRLSSADGWNQVAEAINDSSLLTSDVYFELENDIDFASVDATVIREFHGTFNGNGHTLSNVTITSDQDNFGIFCMNYGLIKDITVKDAVINSTNLQTGGIAGRNDGTIDGCCFSGTINGSGGTGTSDGAQTMGGIAGMNYGTVVNCGVLGGSILAKSASYSQSLGGVVGQNIQTAGYIVNCYSWLEKIESSQNNHGGVLGICSSDSFVINCYSTLEVIETTGGTYGPVVGYSKVGNLQNIYGNSACSTTNKSGSTVGNDKAAGAVYKTTTGALLTLENMISGAVTVPSSGEECESFVAALNAGVKIFNETTTSTLAKKPDVTLREWTSNGSYPVLK